VIANGNKPTAQWVLGFEKETPWQEGQGVIYPWCVGPHRLAKFQLDSVIRGMWFLVGAGAQMRRCRRQRCSHR